MSWREIVPLLGRVYVGAASLFFLTEYTVPIAIGITENTRMLTRDKSGIFIFICLQFYF